VEALSTTVTPTPGAISASALRQLKITSSEL
jgi:hypothetical protein